MTWKAWCLVLLCSSAAVAEPTKDIHIGLASNFSELSTGSANPYGGYFKDGVTLALQHSAKKLKLKGLKIIFDEFDYGTSDIKVLDATRRAIASDVVAVLGYNYSSNALLAAPLHQDAKLPMLTPSASANRLGTMGRYVHMGCFDNNFMGEALAQVAFTKLKAKKAVLLPAADCAYCSDLADSFERAFRARGGSTVAKIPVLLEDKDFSSAIERIKDTDFDVVLIPNQELTSARMIASLARAGIAKPFLGADGWGNVGEEFFAILSGVQFSGYSVSHWSPQVSAKSSLTFVKEYRESFNKIPNDTSVLAYDSMSLLIEAILHAKSFTREGVENALNSMSHFEGITGSFIMTANKSPRKSLLLLKATGNKFQVIDHISAKNVGGAS